MIDSNKQDLTRKLIVVNPGFVPFLPDERFKDYGYLGTFGIPYQHESLDSSKAFLAKHCGTALNAVKGISLKALLAFIAQERNAAEVKQVLKKHLKFEDQAKIENAYTSLRGYAVNIANRTRVMKASTA